MTAERDCWLLTERWELVGHTWALFGVPVSRSIYLDPLYFLDAEDLLASKLRVTANSTVASEIGFRPNTLF